MSWRPAHTVLVANPAAAGGRVGRRWARIEARLLERLGPVRCVLTEAPGDATRLAREAAAEGADAVLALGGDGTLGAVAAGLAGTGTALGVLPAGSGGDLRRSLPAATDLWTAAAALPRAEARPIDLGRFTGVDDAGAPVAGTFLNLASCGVSGLVDRLVNASAKPLGGTVAFAGATLRAHHRYRPAPVRLTLDGEDRGVHTVATVIAANGRYAGGGMCFAPDARLDDGLLDCVVLPHRGLLASLPLLAALYRGAHVRRADVLTMRGRRLEVTPLDDDAPAWLDVDGEAPGRAPATFEVQPGALRLLTPAGR